MTCTKCPGNICVLSHSVMSDSLQPHRTKAPLSMGFSRQECWNGLPFPSPGDLPNLGIKHASRASPELAGEFFTAEPPGNPKIGSNFFQKIGIPLLLD